MNLAGELSDQDFLEQLGALMDKAGASIEWDCDTDSDTFGIRGARMVIRRENRELLTVKGDCLDGTNLPGPDPAPVVSSQHAQLVVVEPDFVISFSAVYEGQRLDLNVRLPYSEMVPGRTIETGCRISVKEEG